MNLNGYCRSDGGTGDALLAKWRFVFLLVLLPASLAAQSGPAPDLARIWLSEASIFSAPDGGPIRVAPGAYSLAAGEAGSLTLTPQPGEAAQVLRAKTARHDLKLEAATGISVAGTGGEQHIALLLPDGSLLEAVSRGGEVVERGVAPGPISTPQLRYQASIKIQASASPNPTITAGMTPRFQEYLAAPTPTNLSRFTARVEEFMSAFPHGDVMASLFYVFRESIEQANHDKRYFLEELKTMQDLASALGDYLKTLNDASRQLSESIPGGGSGGGCGNEDDSIKDARAAADSLYKALARTDFRTVPLTTRSSITELRRRIEREAVVLAEMQRLVGDISASKPVSPPPRVR
jgi:hypothetical protein